MGILGLFSNKDQEKNLFLSSIGFFISQHCYSTHCLIGQISDQLVRDDSDPTIISNAMKETCLISELAKKQCLQLVNSSTLCIEDRNFISDYAKIYDLLGIQSNAVIDYIDSDGEEKFLNIIIQSRTKSWEKISHYIELGKKMLENA